MTALSELRRAAALALGLAGFAALSGGAEAADYAYGSGTAAMVPAGIQDGFGYEHFGYTGRGYPIYGYGGYIGPYYRNGCYGVRLDCGPAIVHRIKHARRR
jgi:hypothetical protein